MSAPPMGSTIVIPNTRPATTTIPNKASVAVLSSSIAPPAPRISAIVPSTAITARAMVTIWPPGT